LILAHSCRIALDAFTLTVDRSIEPPAPSAMWPLPRFLAEWQETPNLLCCVRSQVEGIVTWHPNEAFAQAVGDQSTLLAMLQSERRDITSSADFLTCMAEVFLAIVLHPTDRVQLAYLNGKLWSSLSEEGGVRKAEATVPAAVRCVLRSGRDNGLGGGGGAQTHGGPDLQRGGSDGESTYQPCVLRGRTVVSADSRSVFSAFTLTPVVVPAAHAVGGGGGQADNEWPLDELMATMLAPPHLLANNGGNSERRGYNGGDGAGHRDAGWDGNDHRELRYEELESLGLVLEPEDAALLVDSAADGE